METLFIFTSVVCTFLFGLEHCEYAIHYVFKVLVKKFSVKQDDSN